MEDKRVIDVSHWDGNVDYDAWVRKHDLWGVIIKAGGNETNLGRYRDSWFDKNYQKAKAAGLHIGAYYYTVSTDNSNSRKDADHFADLLDGYDLDLPAYMDVEDPRQFQLSKKDLTNVIKTFCDRLQDRGYYAGLYTGGSAWLNNMYPDELSAYADWIAWWQGRWPDAAGDIGMWQQGAMRLSDGDVVFDDVGGYTDLDWCRVDYPSRINHGSTSQDDLEQPDSESLNDEKLYYQVHCQSVGWQETVKDGQIAGTVGKALRMEALKIYPPKGVEFNVKAHLQKIGDKEYNIKNGNDVTIGTTGEKRRLEAITINCVKNDKGLPLHYQGHVQGYGWMDVCSEGELCGTTGEGKRLEAIRIWFGDEKPQEQKSEPKQETRRPTAEDIMNVAYGELGYYAPDDPERGSKYGRWSAERTGEDWMAGPSTEIWWCCMFTSWVLDHANVKMDGFPSQNTDVALSNGARKYAVDKYDVQRGDIIIFNWDWDGATDHIGFATGPYDGYGFPTIEGNVGNAVKEMYRQLGNVAYVLRPPYDNQENATPVESKNNRDGSSLDIDGIGGWNTIIDWQNQLGTFEDGTISGQDRDNKNYYPNIFNVTFEEDGSALVEAIQKKVGAEPDGIWGKETSIKVKEWLVNKGYLDEVGTDQFGEASVKALQKSLNDKAWE